MSSSALADIVDWGALSGMDSLLITRHGNVVTEAFYAPFRAGQKHAVNSTTKGIVGTLTGMAIQDGLIASRDLPVIDFFPEHTPANLDEAKKSISVGNLLDMTSGIEWKEKLDNSVPLSMLQMARSSDWQAFVLDQPMAADPGKTFNYSSGNAHLMSSILAKKTGGSTLAYAQKRLFGPLGITDVRWSKDPHGVEIGGYGIFLQPRDMAKIGYLYLRKGQWEGKQLLPASWINKVFSASVDMGFGDHPAFKYANGWWTIPEKHAYMTVGFLRQMIIVLPDVDVVAVVTGHRHYPIPTLIDKITAAVRSNEPLPVNAEAQKRLAERIHQASIEQPLKATAESPLATTVSGKSWEFDRNPLNVKRLTLNLAASPPTYEVLYETGRKAAGQVSLDGVFRVTEQFADKPFGLKGSWIDPQTFRLVSREINDGLETTYLLHFDGNAVNVTVESNSGLKAQVQGHLAQ